MLQNEASKVSFYLLSRPFITAQLSCAQNGPKFLRMSSDKEERSLERTIAIFAMRRLSKIPDRYPKCREKHRRETEQSGRRYPELCKLPDVPATTIPPRDRSHAINRVMKRKKGRLRSRAKVGIRGIGTNYRTEGTNGGHRGGAAGA